jgi:signal transduction histidine kinase
MDRFHSHLQKTRLLIFLGIFTYGLVLLFTAFGCNVFFPNNAFVLWGACTAVALGLAAALAHLFSAYATEPLEYIWRAIVHVSPNGNSVPAPNLDHNTVAPELVSSLVMQVYELASSGPKELRDNKTAAATEELSRTITTNFPLPVLAVDKNHSIIYANEAAFRYLDAQPADLLHKSFYSSFDLSFTDGNTIDSWLRDCRANKATDTHAWQRVQLKLNDGRPKQFDMAAAYSKANPAGAEVIITLFDQTQRYQSDDQALDFIALAVHELRTPLTALHGYIEVFEDEFQGKLDPELTDFMHKMQASAKQLTAFVNNILKVARLEQGQVVLQLTEENWQDIVKNAVDNLQLQAQVRGIKIAYNVADDIPPVAVDKISIIEVINNLVDNAIKYSGTGKLITITSRRTNDGMVETVVHDDGVGIPSSVLPHLFEKFHRNHRNQSKIGGTGLGLYLCSALIQAHGGNIWVKSKEDAGTAIGFTVQPYSMLADSQKNSHNTDITRNAHGWIKNHSLYRR